VAELARRLAVVVESEHVVLDEVRKPRLLIAFTQQEHVVFGQCLHLFRNAEVALLQRDLSASGRYAIGPSHVDGVGARQRASACAARSWLAALTWLDGVQALRQVLTRLARALLQEHGQRRTPVDVVNQPPVELHPRLTKPPLRAFAVGVE